MADFSPIENVWAILVTSTMNSGLQLPLHADKLMMKFFFQKLMNSLSARAEAVNSK